MNELNEHETDAHEAIDQEVGPLDKDRAFLELILVIVVASIVLDVFCTTLLTLLEWIF